MILLSNDYRDLHLQKTRLGWVIAGRRKSIQKHFVCQLTNLERQIARFWTIKETTINTSKSIEEHKCEEHFVKHITRDKTGRYTVRLSFRNDNKRIREVL